MWRIFFLNSTVYRCLFLIDLDWTFDGDDEDDVSILLFTLLLLTSPCSICIELLSIDPTEGKEK